MTANAGYHAYATGDVLTAAQVQYNLQNQTCMYFATTTARDAALTGAILVEGMVSYTPATGVMYYNGTAWTAVGSTIPTSYGFTAGKNKIINGDFGIWQRGTSFSPTTVTWTYTSDRFQCYYGFSAGTATVARQTFTPGTAPVAGYEGLYYLRFTAATTGTSNFNIKQVIENVQTFAGQTVTFSFWAKSSGSRNIDIFIRQNFGSGGSASVDSTVSTITTTTAWQRFTYTTTLASISGKTIGTNSGLEIWPATSATVTGGETVDFWGWQVEAGSVATAFQTATGTLQGELAACQRYFMTYGGSAGQNFATGQAYSTTQAWQFNIALPVTMRVSPSITILSAASDFYLSSSSASNIVAATVVAQAGDISTTTGALRATVASGLVAGNATGLYAVNANAKIQLSSEL